MEKENNRAYIDGQNLHMGTTKLESDAWKVDLQKLRVYLKEKYKVNLCYYFLGFVNEEFQDLYTEIQKAGLILQFREHNSAMTGKKKGNVDSDIIFHIMKTLYKKQLSGKVILVSGDGDYKMVDFLIDEGRFEKILFPNRTFRSSLYKQISNKYFAYLDDVDIKAKIGKNNFWQKEKGALGS
jgi:uncharacterized LabA/DUF88 family protein